MRQVQHRSQTSIPVGVQDKSYVYGQGYAVYVSLTRDVHPLTGIPKVRHEPMALSIVLLSPCDSLQSINETSFVCDHVWYLQVKTLRTSSRTSHDGVLPDIDCGSNTTFLRSLYLYLGIFLYDNGRRHIYGILLRCPCSPHSFVSFNKSTSIMSWPMSAKYGTPHCHYLALY